MGRFFDALKAGVSIDSTVTAMPSPRLKTTFLAIALAVLVACAGQRAESVKLYVLDGGTLHVSDPARFQLTKADVGETNFAVACYLVTHPKGTLLWDACAVPDSEWTPTGSPVKHHLVLPDSQERDVTLVKPLTAQLADAGYSPANITYFALFALSLRSHGQRESVSQGHVARAAERARRDVRHSAPRCNPSLNL